MVRLGLCQAKDANILKIPHLLHETIKPATFPYAPLLPPTEAFEISKNVLFDTSYDDSLLAEARQILSNRFPLRDVATIDAFVKGALESLRAENVHGAGNSSCERSIRETSMYCSIDTTEQVY